MARAGEEEQEDKHDSPRRQKPFSSSAGALQPVRRRARARDGLPAWQRRRVHRSGSSSAPWSSLADPVPMVQILDVPVPQPVDQLVEVLRLIDTMVPEQVIDVPKITSQDVIPQRAVLRVPQMAEQLVHEFCFSSTTLSFVEEEQEEEQPSLVPESYFRDDFGREWCRVHGPGGVYWWMVGTSTVQWTPPEGYTARPGRYRNTGLRWGSGG